MHQLISSNPSTLTSEQKQAGFAAFSAATGFASPDFTTVFNQVIDQQQEIVNFTSYYMYAPTLLLSIIVIWLGVAYKWFNWVVGLFLTVLAIIVLYGFSVLYRFTAKTWLREQNQASLVVAQSLEKDFEDSVAFWPQALFDVSCAVVNAGPVNCGGGHKQPKPRRSKQGEQRF